MGSRTCETLHLWQVALATCRSSAETRNLRWLELYFEIWEGSRVLIYIYTPIGVSLVFQGIIVRIQYFRILVLCIYSTLYIYICVCVYMRIMIPWKSKDKGLVDRGGWIACVFGSPTTAHCIYHIWVLQSHRPIGPNICALENLL